jgi:23S rRNA pseudouridine2605 synthase
MVLDGQRLKPARVRLVGREGEQSILSVTITQGKNRQIRRMCAQCGLEVRRLKRIREGSLKLDRKLAPGQWRPLTQEEADRLREESFLQE